MIPHGTVNGYNNYGCRCELCKAAARPYNWAHRNVACIDCGKLVWRRGTRDDMRCRPCAGIARSHPLVHGTETGYSKGCKCSDCRAAAARARRDRRRRAAA